MYNMDCSYLLRSIDLGFFWESRVIPQVVLVIDYFVVILSKAKGVFRIVSGTG